MSCVGQYAEEPYTWDYLSETYERPSVTFCLKSD